MPCDEAGAYTVAAQAAMLAMIDRNIMLSWVKRSMGGLGEKID